jgi:hypothetical protein
VTLKFSHSEREGNNLKIKFMESLKGGKFKSLEVEMMKKIIGGKDAPVQTQASILTYFGPGQAAWDTVIYDDSPGGGGSA